MTRMIERWFPCAEVSANSDKGWGSGNTERNLFTWFAARPTAQAKAAVICSLLPWPDDEHEQKRLRDLVKRAMTGRYAAWDELRAEILAANPDGVSILDPFSGRGMIPLEAARLGIPSQAIDYSPVAVLASTLLADYPFRDWESEPPLPFASGTVAHQAPLGPKLGSRLLEDIRTVVAEVGRRHRADMQEFYPIVNGRQPWGYLWAVSIPCQECGRRFPLVGSYELIRERGGHQPQSFTIEVDQTSGRFWAEVHDGVARRTPTLSNAIAADGSKMVGKSATCPFCHHPHPVATHRRLINEGQGRDELLLVADIDDDASKSFRAPTSDELMAAKAASRQLGREDRLTPLLPVVPDEVIAPGNNNIIGPSIYGARTYGDFMVDRQTLAYARLARAINDVYGEMLEANLSGDYAVALTSYATGVVMKKLRRSTRGARFQSTGGARVGDVFVNEGSITFSHDFFEPGIGQGPGTWSSISDNFLTTLRNLLTDIRGTPVTIERGTATSLPQADGTVTAVTTDPPYDQMIAYADASDLFYAWMKRCLARARPDFAITSDPGGAQEKTLEIIVKRSRGLAKSDVKDHRTREHYDRLILQSFIEMRRVVVQDGVVTIVFGHGDPEVWQRLLGAISGAGLVMTGSWPARTEAGGQQGKANIETTLTMSCRPASANRPYGMKASVESEVKAEVKSRIDLWEKSGLAPTDMLMASAGPAMEVVGRYERVLDIAGEPVDPTEYLVVARRAVQEDARIEIDHHPLDTFDARTRFALWWVQLFGKNETAKSEMRWQTLAADMDLAAVRDLMLETGKGVRFTDASRFKGVTTHESAVIDVALAMAAAWPEGMDAVGAVLAASGREDDPYLWAAVKFLSNRLPEADPDSIAWTKIIRNQAGVTASARGAAADAASVQESLDFSGGTGV